MRISTTSCVMEVVRDNPLIRASEIVKKLADVSNSAPEIIEARKIVAKLLQGSGDNAGAGAVMSGARDNTMLVRACVEALNSVLS